MRPYFYIPFTAEKPSEEEERQRLCCAWPQSPENGLLSCGYKVFLLSGHMVVCPARGHPCTPRSSPWESRLSNQDRVILCTALPLGRVSTCRQILLSFDCQTLLCLPSPLPSHFPLFSAFLETS